MADASQRATSFFVWSMRTRSLRLLISAGNRVADGDRQQRSACRVLRGVVSEQSLETPHSVRLQDMTLAVARYIIAAVDNADQSANDRVPRPLDTMPAGTRLLRGQAEPQGGPIMITLRPGFSSSVARLIGGVIGIALLIAVALIFFVMLSLFVLALATASLLLLYAVGRWTRALKHRRSTEE